MPIYFGESRSTPVKILATGPSTVKAAGASEMSSPSAVEKIGVGSASLTVMMISSVLIKSPTV